MDPESKAREIVVALRLLIATDSLRCGQSLAFLSFNTAHAIALDMQPSAIKMALYSYHYGDMSSLVV